MHLIWVNMKLKLVSSLNNSVEKGVSNHMSELGQGIRIYC
jgi:hypothetical protein